MTTPPALPSIPGLTWPRHKRPTFSTRIASHVSGREVRTPLMAYPLYEFEAAYDGLSSSSNAFPGLGDSTLQSLMGFFLQLQGQFGTFLYVDPDDSAVAGQAIAAGEGSTQSFTLVRSIGGYTEPASWVTALINVYVDGVLQMSGHSLTAPNTLTFTSAPASGKPITADFQYAFECRFLDDEMGFEEFMTSLWQLESMKFRSVKAKP